MATVICSMNCAHRSSRPLRKWRYKDGRKCYGCKLETVSVSRIFDPDGDVLDTVGEDCMAQCADYEPLDRDENEEAEDW